MMPTEQSTLNAWGPGQSATSLLLWYAGPTVTADQLPISEHLRGVQPSSSFKTCIRTFTWDSLKWRDTQLHSVRNRKLKCTEGALIPGCSGATKPHVRFCGQGSPPATSSLLKRHRGLPGLSVPLYSRHLRCSLSSWPGNGIKHGGTEAGWKVLQRLLASWSQKPRIKHLAKRSK